jgi:hypothetical protein
MGPAAVPDGEDVPGGVVWLFPVHADATPDSSASVASIKSSFFIVIRIPRVSIYLRGLAYFP